MSLASPRLDGRQIRLTFELHRLSQANLAKAYEKIVPVHVCVLSQHERKQLMQYIHEAPSTDRKRRMA